MSAPTPVTVVRPYKSVADAIAGLLGALVNLALRGLIVMWAAPLATSDRWHPSYWTALSATVLVGALVRGGVGDYTEWTRRARKDEK